MKKLLSLIIILLLIGGSAAVFSDAANDAYDTLVGTLIGAIEDDFTLLLSGLGEDISPVLMQNAMTGQNIGMAELGTEFFSNFYISVLPTVSFTVTDGIFKFTDTQAYEDSLILKGMLNSLLFAEPDGLLAGTADWVDIILDKATPIPAFKLNAGAKLPANLEILVHGMWMPQFITGLIPDDVMSDIPGGLLPTFNYLNIGGELRYVLLRDSEQTPGFSIGLGGAYNKMGLEMGVGELLNDALGDSLGEAPPGSTNPFTAAGMSISSSAVVFGINSTLSKKLAIFYPFVKLGAWYSITDFSGTVTIMEGSVIEGGAANNDLNMLVSTGADMMLGPFGSNLTVDYNPGSGVWGLSLGSRLQF